MIVKEMANVNRYVGDANLADIDRTEISINDLEPPATANRARQTSPRYRPNPQFSSGLFRKHRHARTSVKYETKIVLRAIDSNFDDRAIIAVLELDQIGRASCRERGEISVVGGIVKKKGK